MMRTWNFEGRLQEVVAEYPHLATANPVALAAREFSMYGGSADIILFDRKGRLTVVETKLLRNDDYEQVIDQALRYRDMLIAAPIDNAKRLESQFRLTIQRYFKEGRNAYLRKRFGISPEDATQLAQGLRESIAVSICEGDVQITIVADAISDKLATNAELLQRQQDSITVNLVELLPATDGNYKSRRMIESATQRNATWMRPAFAEPSWEQVETVETPSQQFRENPLDDRFSRYGGHRVLLIAQGFPKTFRRERAFARVPAIGTDIHQVDPSRTESCAPLMPDLRRLHDTRNPYPNCKIDELITDRHYEPFVRISHETWNTLNSRRHAGQLIVNGIDDPLVSEIVKRAKVDSNAAPPGDAFRCVIHTLRDLALWGLVEQDRRRLHQRRFTVSDRALSSGIRL